MVGGKYTDDSYRTERATQDSIRSDSASNYCDKPNIDPAIVKVLKNKRFHNSFIATREFEQRYKSIRRACNPKVLDIYLQNLDKDLWISDSLAAAYLKINWRSCCERCDSNSYTLRYSTMFLNFSRQKLTNVKDAGKYGPMLKAFFEKRLKEVETELENARNKQIKKLNKKNEEAQKKADEYKAILLKREAARMTGYGYVWTDNGWANIDIGTAPKKHRKCTLDYLVENGAGMDRVHCYAIFGGSQSLYHLNTTDKIHHYVGNEANHALEMDLDKPSIAVCVGYKGDTPWLAVAKFTSCTDTQLQFTLTKSTVAEVKKVLREYDPNEAFNQVKVDLEYQQFFYSENVRQSMLMKEAEFISYLHYLAWVCCRCA